MPVKSIAKPKRWAAQIKFTVPAVPVAQPRQRHAIRGKGKRQFVSNYTPTKHPVNNFKATVRMAAQQYPIKMFTGPLRVDCVFVLPRPQNKRWKTKPMPRYYHTTKPDKDNLEKAVLDALSGILWVNDSQVSAGDVIKFVAAGDEQPHVEITVSELKEIDDEN